LAVAFPGNYGQIRERPSTYVYPEYNVMQNNWPYRSKLIINPSQTVLDELKLIVDIINENNTLQTSRKRRSEMRFEPENDKARASAFQAKRLESTEEIIQGRNNNFDICVIIL